LYIIFEIYLAKFQERNTSVGASWCEWVIIYTNVAACMHASYDFEGLCYQPKNIKYAIKNYSNITFNSIHCLYMDSTVDGVEYTTPNSTSSVAKRTSEGTR
jgi:hypothetical protein